MPYLPAEPCLLPTNSAPDNDTELSVTSLFQPALAAVARALDGTDQRLSLQAARIILDQCRRIQPPPEDQEQQIKIVYSQAPYDRNPGYSSPRSPSIARPVQGRGVRPLPGQPPTWLDRNDG
ncbi:MAG: hypothetical protein ACYDBJ_20420 [Aggregatilineales bacterium]